MSAPNRPAPRIARLAIALLALTAVAVQFGSAWDDPDFRAVNFFSYFTMQSNLFAAGVLFAAALSPSPADNRRIDSLRGAAVVYMTVTGVVYWLLLAGERPDGTSGFASALLHGVIPAAVLADWVAWPPRSPLRARSVIAWLAFPVAYFTYVLIRGAIGGWYPYEFMDADEEGYVAVLVFGFVNLIALMALIAAVAILGNRLGRTTAGAGATRGAMADASRSSGSAPRAG